MPQLCSFFIFRLVGWLGGRLVWPVMIETCRLHHWLALELYFYNLMDFCHFSKANWPNFEVKMTLNNKICSTTTTLLRGGVAAPSSRHRTTSKFFLVQYTMKWCAHLLNIKALTMFFHEPPC